MAKSNDLVIQRDDLIGRHFALHSLEPSGLDIAMSCPNGVLQSLRLTAESNTRHAIQDARMGIIGPGAVKCVRPFEQIAIRVRYDSVESPVELLSMSAGV